MAALRDEYSAIIATPLPGEWRLGFRYKNASLVEIDFLPAATPLINALPEAVAAASQMQRYFEKPQVGFRVALMPAGTPYQQQVWTALMAIPAGESRRYGVLAQQLASGARAIAAACRANPLPIVIPCHRVVAAKGVGGYMGTLDGPELAIKQWLLEHESQT